MSNYSDSGSEAGWSDSEDGQSYSSEGNWDGKIESTPDLDNLDQELEAKEQKAREYYSQRRLPKVTILEQMEDEKEEYRKALRRLQSAYFTNRILAEPEKHFANPAIAAYYSAKEVRTNSHTWVGALVVVNFDPKIFNFNDDTIRANVEMHVIKACHKKWVSSWMYSWEQRGRTEEELGTGVHLNILVTYKQPGIRKASEVRNEFHNTFKAWCPNKPAVHVTPYADMTNGINYVKGLKSDEDKMELVKMDRLWRAKVGLRDYYASSH